ncbi:MAG TPA: putative transporter [Verrucomicrobiae bacterium]|nr:putative transporter [Verrucomicrobiae bacterium]
MQWLNQLSTTQPVAWAVLVLSAVGALGLALASLKVRGVGLGIAGVLFAGIVVGHFGVHIEHGILEFVREFGLILFVFTIGLQLGPSFFASLRKQGLKLNALALSVIVLGVVVTLGIANKILGVDLIAALGLFSGATTNTPSLGATQETLKSLGPAFADKATLPALAYAVAYPGGVLGIILTLLGLRLLFRINPEEEAEKYRSEQRQGVDAIERMNILVQNANLEGLTIGDIPGRREIGVVVSRLKRKDANEVQTVTDHTVLRQGDIILAVGSRRNLEKFRLIVGVESEVNLSKAPGRVVTRKVVVTRKAVLGKTIHGLELDERYGVTVTRVVRADIEFTALPDLQLQFSDVVQLVGEEAGITRAAEELGNSVRALNETNFVPIFVGIALGVLFGTMPIYFPGMPVPVRLGLAGGPLLLAIILSRVGRIGSLVWYMPANANTAFRELGIVLFLACVGLKAGGKFFSTVFTQEGLLWLVGGFAITVLPLLIVGIVARSIMKMNFTVISGLLSGSMTDPPALAFANAICKSDAPSVAYATVYPLTMLLRIVAVQILVLLFYR